jgi:hypothetical protein
MDMSDRRSNLRQRVRITTTLKRQSPYYRKVGLLLAQDISAAWDSDNTLQEHENNAQPKLPDEPHDQLQIPPRSPRMDGPEPLFDHWFE